MNYIYHDLIGKLVKIYIDDVVVKSTSIGGHLGDLRQVFKRTRRFGLKMNPKKCAFGVSAGQFLGFLVQEQEIKISLKSQEAVRTMVPPAMKRELQQLIGKINFVGRFISNLSGRIEPFMDLVKIKADKEFRWGGGRTTTSVRRNQRISAKTARVGSSSAGQAVLHLFVSGRYLHHLIGDTSV
jgi:hypothetical protein